MSKNNGKSWNTKDGRRRVRQEDPTVEEAIAAAQGLTDELDAQVEIAASLIGLPQDQVRTRLLKLARPRKDVVKSLVFTGRESVPRAVVVERKLFRRAGVPMPRATFWK